MEQLAFLKRRRVVKTNKLNDGKNQPPICITETTNEGSSSQEGGA
jgi:hypothetical protein